MGRKEDNKACEQTALNKKTIQKAKDNFDLPAGILDLYY